MPNSLGPNGLQTKTRAELVAEFTAAYQAIYGADINLDQDSPDGQMMNIYIQAILDNLDLLTQIYNQFDPDKAFGRVLDQRVSYNGIQRQAGTKTITPITITTNQAVNLYGTNQTDEPVFTVADNSGNEWELVATANIGSAGAHVLTFRAKLPGKTLTTPNTITVPVTIVLGVTAINNPSTYTTLGLDEESDQDLKVRRQRSVALASQGYLAGLIAALENISGVNAAFVYENNTGTTDSDGIPSHSIWVIISGGDASDIATAIYQKRNAGCGMKGDQSLTITQVDGSPFLVKWDNVETEDLYIAFEVESLNGVDPVDVAALLAEIPEMLKPGVFGQVNANQLATIVQQIDMNALALNIAFSNAPITIYNPGVKVLQPDAKNKIFSITTANIDIVEL